MPEARTWNAADLVEEVNRRLLTRMPSAGGLGAFGPYTVRALRFHRSLGLVSPPLGRRGKTLLFVDRHLDEILAIRRLQAAGWDLPRIGALLEIRQRREEVPREVANEPPGPLRVELLTGLTELLRERAGTPSAFASRAEARQPVEARQIAPGVYLVIDRSTFRPEDAPDRFRVAERISGWLADAQASDEATAGDGGDRL